MGVHTSFKMTGYAQSFRGSGAVCWRSLALENHLEEELPGRMDLTYFHSYPRRFLLKPSSLGDLSVLLRGRVEAVYVLL